MVTAMNPAGSYISSLCPLSHVTLQAFTPDQMLPYVQAVSAVHSHVFHDVLVHTQGAHAIVVGYTLHKPWWQQKNISQHLESTLHKLCAQQDLEHITVLATHRPVMAPPHALCHEDTYYFLPLPLNTQAAANALQMSRRALPHIHIVQSHGEQAWTGAHQELMLSYLQKPHISKEMGLIFQRLGNYCRAVPELRLFSAYDKSNQKLLGMALGDFSSLQTAFYMFAFRHANAIPGVSEALLLALVHEAEQRGYASCNLGLGIHDGIRFFKEKWGAQAALPLVESSWALTPQISPSPKSTPAWQWLRNLWRKSL